MCSTFCSFFSRFNKTLFYCFMLSLPKFKVVPYFIFYFDPIKTEIVLFVLIPIKYRAQFQFQLEQPLLLHQYRVYTLRIENTEERYLKIVNVLIMTRLYQPGRKAVIVIQYQINHSPGLETGQRFHNPIFSQTFRHKILDL